MSRNQEREDRIADEVTVDAYTEEEEAMGWYYYVENCLSDSLPFKAKWSRGGRSRDLIIDVVGMPSEDECQHEVFVEVRYEEGGVEDFFSARLGDIQPLDLPEGSLVHQAIGDWNYWRGNGI